MNRKATTRVTRGHQVTIPKVVRDNAGLKVGDLLEVTVEDDGGILMRRLPMGEPPILEWGKEFARMHKITGDQILHAVRSMRSSLFKNEYV